MYTIIKRKYLVIIIIFDYLYVKTYKILKCCETQVITPRDYL